MTPQAQSLILVVEMKKKKICHLFRSTRSLLTGRKRSITFCGSVSTSYRFSRALLQWTVFFSTSSVRQSELRGKKLGRSRRVDGGVHSRRCYDNKTEPSLALRTGITCDYPCVTVPYSTLSGHGRP